ncbi:hypothetical protein BS47DRAFT_31070 [Hydnum rufescens UP504]|uniref:HNH nuclease domain-containing protein n=1 Tax=Hydnum rufescens UP504 TaxID=1448309 RepID=A0A9P6E1F2_9AGAM|nr:hypothetical protein BS47DRAFT_31070 [Hydnum rufescens UP504]
MDSITVHVQISGVYLPVLSIPVVECHRFAFKPLKWLRFLGYTIYGQEGHISLSPGADSVDYESAIEGGVHYFYVSPLPPRLLDTRCINDEISDADTTESRAEFLDHLVDRDGGCIVTNATPQYCDACHYYPRSKGSEYIQQLMLNRGDGDIDIDDINDVRIGLVLCNALHRKFEVGQVAFLKTPNFALSDNDIPPSPGRSAVL